MSERVPRPEPAAVRRETQFLGQDELVVYEAVATVRRPMGVGDVAATTGMDQDTVRDVLGRLVERGILVDGVDGVTVGPNDWDVRGAGGWSG